MIKYMFSGVVLNYLSKTNEMLFLSQVILHIVYGCSHDSLSSNSKSDQKLREVEYSPLLNFVFRMRPFQDIKRHLGKFRKISLVMVSLLNFK